ncbi:hypothetical protein FSARC_3921 [Fusarium sarcochroum]|uniref:Uncharacterized protein n=1 Tax=Fusarium sarcochroum TaxID=1208366 RepID=A0A8H4U3D9_9HYPO|nr:hypothetical protein FSARC_3921 [Fusarium sarcochroum]
MADSHSETISDNEFIGCCTHNPCRDGSGLCLENGLRAASFAADKSDDLKKQSCDDTRGSKVWWTCPDTNPPFMGCCDISPCDDDCSQSNLLPAVLSKNKEDRRAFLDPEAYAASKSASTATSTASSSSSGSNAGLSTGAIVGIAVGSAAVGIMLISFLTCIIWRCRRKRKEPPEMVQSGESHRASETGQSPMTYDGQYFPSTSTVTPYYLSRLSMDHNKPSPPLPASHQPYNSYNMNSTVDHNYEPSSPPAHMMTVHEMDGVDRTPHELSTDPLEEYYEGQEQSPVRGHITPRIHN